MVMTHNAAPRASVLGLCAAALILATGAFVMPGLACPPEEQAKAKSTGGQFRAPATTEPGQTPFGQSAAPAPMPTDGVTFFGEAPALEAMKVGATSPGGVFAPAPPSPEPPAPAQAPRAPKPPKAPNPPRKPRAASPLLAPGAPLQTFGLTTAGVDLEALKEGRTAREYPMSEGKLQCFWNMMRRDDVPILVELGDEHITIWGTDAEHEVFAKFVQIVDGKSALNPVVASAVEGEHLAKLRAEELVALAGQSQVAAIEAQRAAEVDRATAVRGLALDRAVRSRAEAAKAREEAALARGAAELSERAKVNQDQRREMERAAEELRTHARSLESASRSTEQRVRELERQIRVMEERARKLERQLDDAQDRPTKSRNSGQKPAPEESAKTAPTNLYETLLQSLMSGPAA